MTVKIRMQYEFVTHETSETDYIRSWFVFGFEMTFGKEKFFLRIFLIVRNTRATRKNEVQEKDVCSYPSVAVPF